MAGYCTIAEVEATLAGAIQLDENSKPTRARVELEIDEVSSQLNVALAMGEVALPIAVTETDLLNDLKRLTRREVGYQARTMAVVVVDDGKDALWVHWHEEFLEALKLMRAGEFTSLGVSDDAGPESHTMNAEEDEEDPSLDPVFTRSRRF